MDLLLVKALEAVLNTSLLKPWHHSRPVTAKALDNVSCCLAVLLSAECVLALLLEELLLLLTA